MFYYLVVLPPCLTQPLSTSLMFCWVVGQLWLLVDGQLLPLGVGWQDCQSFAHIHTPPTLAILHLHALFLGLFNLTPIFGLLAHPHAQVSLMAGLFILMQRFVRPPDGLLICAQR